MAKKYCGHEDYAWNLTGCNETGWKCQTCGHQPGEPPGYSPTLDRANILEKVGGILMLMHMGDWLYVSNGSGGDGITAMVADRCRREGVYDQRSIVRFILDVGGDEHAAYYKKQGEAILAGKDDRKRCTCGALSTCTSMGGGKPDTYTCSKCFNPLSALLAETTMSPEERARMDKALDEAWSEWSEDTN